ncbi:MAG: SMI1/KNR4 family protein [Armatimonadota bacterium]
MEINITGSYPVPAQTNTSSDVWNFFQALPTAYRRFLSIHNGGFIPEFKYTFLTGVPFKTDKVDNPSRDDCPVEFFGIPTTTEGGNWPADLLKMAAAHKAEQFLPRNIIAITRCVQGSLVCISLSENDFGQIYYWDWYWQYPWCKPFFEQRLDEVRRRYPNAEEIVNTPNHPDLQHMMDDFNYATIVKLADSFDRWISSCTDKSSDLA